MPEQQSLFVEQRLPTPTHAFWQTCVPGLHTELPMQQIVALVHG